MSKSLKSLSTLGTAIALALVPTSSLKAQIQLNSVPEIGWNTRFSSFAVEEDGVGVYSFQCLPAPEKDGYAPVWGTDRYTINSGLCKAAVHAGMIDANGGLINVRLLEEESDFLGSDRFEVVSQDYDSNIRAIEFVGNPVTTVSEEPESDGEKRQPSAIERTVGNGVRRGIERAIADSIRDIFR